MINKPITALILLYLYFMIPKFDLFSIPGTVTGFRIQDIISFILFLILFDYKLKKNALILVIIMFVHLIYSIIAWESYTSILGFLRLIEYYFVAKGLAYVVDKGYWRNFVNFILLSIAFFSLGQYLSVFPNFDPARGIYYGVQFSGPFGTPAELTYFLIAILYMSYYVDRIGIIKLASSTLVLFNGVKAGILGFIVLFAQRIQNITSSVFFLFIILTLGTIYFLFDYVLIVAQFLQGILNGAALLTQMKGIYVDVTELSGVTEPSLRLRVEKWSIAISELSQNPLALLFGFGVYSYTFAMDGGVIKFLFEFGLIPFIYLMYILFKTSITFIIMIISVSLLFDSYTSSVVMPVLMSTFIIMNKQLRIYKNAQ